MQRNSFDEVWTALKRWAHRYAVEKHRVPSDDECRDEAERIAVTVLGYRPPDKALDFYGTEACAMIGDIRSELASRLDDGTIS